MKDGRTRTVILDDELPIVNMLTRVCEGEGHLVRPFMRASEALHCLATEPIDLLITDPAYESLEKHRAVGTTTRLKHSKASSNDWFRSFPNARFAELFAEAYRVLRRNRHLHNGALYR